MSVAKISAADLLEEFRRMHREHWAYAWGAARAGCVDCSGAFVYAMRLHGGSIYHGSNRIARRYVTRLIPVAQARTEGLLTPGMAVLKSRVPGAKHYALPTAYRRGGSLDNGDAADYYHIGLLDGETVLNAQSARTGFVSSPLHENWSHVGFLTAVDYGGTAAAPQIALPTLRRGATGENVLLLQRLLNQGGAALSADGIFGAKTEAAVRSFQRARGLSADGIAGPITWAALTAERSNK